MPVNSTEQSIPVKQNWTRSSGGQYIGNNPAGTSAFGNAALGGSITGDTITITTDGTYNFTAKTNAAPMYYWDASDGSLSSSSLSRRSFTLSTGSLAGSSDLTGSTNALRVDIPQFPAEDNLTTGGPFFTDLDGAGDHITLFSKRKTNFTGLQAYSEQQRLGGSDWNVKGWRWWSDVGDNNIVVAYGQSNSISGNPRINTERTSSGSTLFIGSTAVDADAFGFGSGWKTDFYRAKQSTINVTDGLVKYMVNGEQINYAVQTTDTTWPNALRELYWFQSQFLPHELDFAFFYDCFYLDDTPHMVIISDSATWQESETGTMNIEAQIPVTWSTTSITASLRLGEFASLSGKYLYVLDSTGEPVTTTGAAF